MKATDFLSKEEIEFFDDFSEKAYQAFLKRIRKTEEEYRAFCRPDIEKSKRYAELAKSQKGLREKYERDFNSLDKTERYGKGGETIHRGYFCPSLIRDIVIGGCKRGRLCKSKEAKPTYTYYFDRDDRLIAVKHGHDTEFITYDKNRSLGVLYHHDCPETISECEYDEAGRITKYVFLLCDDDGNLLQYEKEAYTYAADAMTVTQSWLNESGLSENSRMHLSVNRYTFTVKDGYLTSYATDIFDCEDITAEPTADRSRRITLKRKI